MKIAHVTATFPPYRGGTGTVCYHNALQLAKLGHEVTVFTARQAGAEDHLSDPPGVAVRRLPVLFRLGNAPFLPGLLGLKGFDLIHLHHPFIFGAEMVWAVSRLHGIPYVLTHHNDLVGDGFRRHLFGAYSALWTRLVVGGATKFAVVSKDHAAHCRLADLFRARWDDVVEIPNGVDTALFRPDLDGSVARQRLGILEDARVILFVGALDRAHHFKGVDLLLRALAQVPDDNCVLVLVGDGDLRRRHEQQARELGLGGRVSFAGSRGHDELPGLYAAADLVVLPSFPPESFGVVLIEAMACGKPVVANGIPGVRSVVKDGENGLLARAGDVLDLSAKLQMLLDDPPRRQRMGELGRKRAEETYAWPQVVFQLALVYTEALSSQPITQPAKS
jgi:glycosyltransferase involved in cell wall biosynthesis